MRDVQTSNPVARSPVSGKSPIAGGVRLRTVDGLGTLNLRMADPKSQAAAAKILGLDIPLQPNTFTTNGETTVFWLGPDEWSVRHRYDRIGELHASLTEALAGGHVAVTDVSDCSIWLQLGGPDARRILEKGCPLDLHPRSFGEGRCAQSHFLNADILVVNTGDGRYLLRARRSMSDFLWEILADAIAKG